MKIFTHNKIIQFNKNQLQQKLVVIVLTAIVAINVAQAKTVEGVSYEYPDGAILLDFGHTDYIYALWNTVMSYTVGTSLSNATDCDGNTTSIGVEVYDAFSAINYSGELSLDSFPDNVSLDNFYGGVYSSDENEPTGGFKLTGLSTDKEYELIILSSRKDITENREVQFVITGSSAADTLYVDCASNTKTISGTYAPDSDGNISIDVSAGPNNENSYGWYHLNAMMVIEKEKSNGISEIEKGTEDCTVYPNPAHNLITVEVMQSSVVKILNYSGKVFQEEKVKAGATGLSLDLNPGLYIVQVTGSDNSINTSKLIVE